MSERLFECRGCAFTCGWSWEPAPCPACRRFYAIRQVRAGSERGPMVDDGERISVNDVVERVDHEDRIVLGRDLAPIDHVLGGGLVPGSMILLAGAPGLGKSTLALAVLRRVAETLPVLYFTGEESVARVAARAKRLGAFSDRCELVREHRLDAILEHVDEAEARVVVVDSIQTIACSSPTTGDALEPGGASAISVATAALAEHAQREDVVVILIGRVTRADTTAGPRGGLDHAVDVVLTLSGDPKEVERTLSAEKNRHGATAHAETVLVMTHGGLVPAHQEEVVQPRARSTTTTRATRRSCVTSPKRYDGSDSARSR